MAAVDQHSQLDILGTAVIHDGIQCGTDGAACEQYIVNQNNFLSGHIKGQFIGGKLGMGSIFAQIVPIRGDVQLAYGNRLTLDLLNFFASRQASGMPRLRIPIKAR